MLKAVAIVAAVVAVVAVCVIPATVAVIATTAGTTAVATTATAVAAGTAVVAGGTAIACEVASENIKEENATSEIATNVSPKQETVIYRYYSSKNENLAPRQGIDYDGLSFSTIPKPGVKSVATTIEAVNATGVLKAVKTSSSHVIIIPIDGSVIEWMNQGMDSEWSRTLSRIVYEI